jgi:hypothetical protein
MTLGADDPLVLDTSAYSHLRGGHADVLELLAQANQVLGIPPVSLTPNMGQTWPNGVSDEATTI